MNAESSQHLTTWMVLWTEYTDGYIASMVDAYSVVVLQKNHALGSSEYPDALASSVVDIPMHQLADWSDPSSSLEPSIYPTSS